MNEDTVIVPLRVPRSVRKEWRVKASGYDMSVQQWLLERIGVSGLSAGSTDEDAQRGVAKARTKTDKVESKSTGESKSPAPSPLNTAQCEFCHKEVSEWSLVNGFVVCEPCRRKAKA